MNPIAEAAEAQRLAMRAMKGIRVIPVTPLGHAADCRICMAVDHWVANRRPRLRSGRSTDSSVPPGQVSAEMDRPLGRREPANGPSAVR